MRLFAVLSFLALGACPAGQGNPSSADTGGPGPSTSADATDESTASPTTGAPTSDPNNQPPVAAVSADKSSGAAPLLVNLDSAGSADPDGQIVAYAWDFGDGEAASGATAQHSYAADGQYTVTLTVSDDDGASAQAHLSVLVGGCPSYAAGAWQGDLGDPDLVEASGLVASRRSPGVMWSHNDSEKTPRIYAFSGKGAAIGVYTLQGVEVRDWEDMALGPGPKPDVDYLYVGDIGDNDEKYPSVTVYRVPEPALDPNQTGVKASLSGVEPLIYTYPESTPHNAETLLVDPQLGDLYIVGKSPDGVSLVFRAAAPLKSGALEQVAALEFGMGGLTTGGSVSAAGDWVLVRTYFGARMWPRPSGAPLHQAFANPFCEVPLAMEMQGEAIGFAAAGTDYYTTSEGEKPPLYRYVRKP